MQNSKERIIFTSSKRLADQLSLIILLSGYYPSFSIDQTEGKEVKFKNGTYTINHDLYRISLNKTRHATMQTMKIDNIPYDDFVYCLELPKYHTLWIRSNNKTCWGGNCKCVPQFSMDSPEGEIANEEAAAAALAYHAEIEFTNFSHLWNQVEDELRILA